MCVGFVFFFVKVGICKISILTISPVEQIEQLKGTGNQVNDLPFVLLKKIILERVAISHT